MKRISILLALVLSLSLLSACGGNEPAANTGNSSSEPSADFQQVPDESAEQMAGIGADFLSPEYDYTTNELKLTDLSTGEVTATYAFDAAQTPLLTDKTSQGAIVMLSSQTAADVQDTGGVTVISGDMPALEPREDGAVWVHPSSWNGKENLSSRISAPLGGIVLLEQGKENCIAPLSPREGVLPLLQQFMALPETEGELLAMAALLERMLRTAPAWKLVNLGDDASTELLRNTLLADLTERGEA